MASQLTPMSLARTRGARLLSAFATTGLYGILCLQVFFYYNTYSKDTKILKSLVLYAWVIATAHQGYMLAYEYDHLVLRVGDEADLLMPLVNTNLICQLLTVFSAVPIQCFFLHRIYRLSGYKRALPIFLVVCVVLEFVTGLLYIGWVLAAKNVEIFIVERVRSTGAIYAVMAAFIDLAIAVAMVYLLRSARVHGMTQTQKIVNRLIVYSVNTGLWTALLAIGHAISMIFFPSSFIYVAITFPLTALYGNTLLVNLNVRSHFRTSQSDVMSISFGAPDATNGVPSFVRRDFPSHRGHDTRRSQDTDEVELSNTSTFIRLSKGKDMDLDSEISQSVIDEKPRTEEGM